MKHFFLFLFLGVYLLVGCQAQPVETASAPGGMGSGMGMGPGMGMDPGMMDRHRAPIPDSYAGLTNPVLARDDALTRGGDLYTLHCTSCHGDGGMGDGPAGQVLDPPAAPIAHTSQMVGDDYLFWRIREGGAAFGTAMPAWKGTLSDDDIWALITYVRALGEGQVQPRGPMGTMNDPAVQATQQAEILAQAVSQGVITQAEADTFTTVHAALDAAFTSFTLLPWFNGLRWLRVHFITLGVLTQALFGLLPGLVAIRTSQPRPKFRWDIWATVNAGLVILLIGIPMMHVYLIFAGGTLVFIATLLFGIQLYGMRNLSGKQPPTLAGDRIDPHIGRKFYLAGLAYFLLGIIVGTGLWLGWGAALRIQTPIEVHIHANNWGLMSLVFAGLLVDLYPRFAGHPLAWPRSITPIFWMMTLGALGLVLGPCFASLYFTVPGLLLHLSATIWLLINVIKPLWGDRPAWTPGIWHLVLSYFWILAPVLVAPLIILGVPGFPGAGIEQNAPQALIYGWVLQFGYALLPFLFRRAFLPEETPKLGGNWFSLIAVNLGGVFLWASIFVSPYTGLLHGTAYALWAISLLPIAVEIWRIVRDGLARLEDAGKPVVQGESPA